MRDPAEFGWLCWINTAYPFPSSTTYGTSLHRYHLPYCPNHRVTSIRQPLGNSGCQSELRHNRSPLLPIPSTVTCLPHIHPPIIQGSLYSIHPPKPRLPSSTSPINFCTHYLFQQSFIIHLDGDQDKMRLCPIRTLKRYFSRTELYYSAFHNVFSTSHH